MKCQALSFLLNAKQTKTIKILCATVLISTLKLNPSPAKAQIFPAFANSVDPDQTVSEEANRSGSNCLQLSM